MRTKDTFRLPKPPLFNFSECLHFLDRGYDDCLYQIRDHTLIKPLIIGGNKLLIRIEEEAGSLTIQIIDGEATASNIQKIGKRVIEWFDLERDLTLFYSRLKNHPDLSFLTTKYHGLRLMGIPDLFEALCWCIIGQQINLTFAHRLKRKLVETYGSAISYGSDLHYLFPEPELLAGLRVRDLKALQFSRQKAEYTIGIARKFADGTLAKHQLSGHNHSSYMLKRLLQIRGVGEWTANYVLMKSLKRMDCIPYGDSGLNNVLSSLLGLERKVTRKEVDAFFEPFAGWESYLVIYLWRTLS